MGWQDRDYARPGGGTSGGAFGGSWMGGSAGGYGSPPWLIQGSITTTLIAVNAVIWILPMFVAPLGNLLYGWGSMQGQAVMHGQIWRLITAQYLHDPNNIMHVGFNMLVLHFLGRHLEVRWSWRRFLLVYTLSGLAGNLFFMVLVLAGVIDPLVPLVGASGCIYGLIGVVAVLFPRMQVYVWGVIPLQMRTFALIMGGVAFLVVAQRGNNFGGEACHLAGLIFGAWWIWRGETLLLGRRDAARPAQSWFSGMTGGGSASGGFQAKVDQRREDAATVDRILRKVHDGGIQTLTSAEKQMLAEATARQQQREQSAGRTDKL